MSKSITSHKGVSLRQGEQNLAFLYGLSDFWTFIFEDPQQVHDVLEANTFLMSDVYNKFLQLTSTLSLEQIQITANSQIKLVLMSEDDAVESDDGAYYLPDNIVNCGMISSRPFLPTKVLEDGVHYEIEDGIVRFSKDLSELGFPARKLSDGTIQYAMWFSDVEVDASFIYRHYGKLLNLTPQGSLKTYKAYVQGLYYLFANGPNLRYLERGLNLVMGVPLARETERVTYVDKHQESNEWIVVTDNQSYVIPYGLEPNVAVGDTIIRGAELASWIEVKDWVEQDNWWINLAIPPEIIPNPPVNAMATAGSDVDYLMANYLKNHTFLVRLKTAGVGNFNIFQNISDVVEKVKPSHTFPVYIWDVPLTDEILDMTDDEFKTAATMHYCEFTSNASWDEFRRDIEKHDRSCPQFIRGNMSGKTNYWITGNMSTVPVLEGMGDGELCLDPNLYTTTDHVINHSGGELVTTAVHALDTGVNVKGTPSSITGVTISSIDIQAGKTYDIEVDVERTIDSDEFYVRADTEGADVSRVDLLNLTTSPDFREILSSSASPLPQDDPVVITPTASLEWVDGEPTFVNSPATLTEWFPSSQNWGVVIEVAVSAAKTGSQTFLGPAIGRSCSVYYHQGGYYAMWIKDALGADKYLAMGTAAIGERVLLEISVTPTGVTAVRNGTTTYTMSGDFSDISLYGFGKIGATTGLANKVIGTVYRCELIDSTGLQNGRVMTPRKSVNRVAMVPEIVLPGDFYLEYHIVRTNAGTNSASRILGTDSGGHYLMVVDSEHATQPNDLVLSGSSYRTFPGDTTTPQGGLQFIQLRRISGVVEAWENKVSLGTVTESGTLRFNVVGGGKTSGGVYTQVLNSSFAGLKIYDYVDGGAWEFDNINDDGAYLRNKADPSGNTDGVWFENDLPMTDAQGDAGRDLFPILNRRYNFDGMRPAGTQMATQLQLGRFMKGNGGARNASSGLIQFTGGFRYKCVWVRQDRIPGSTSTYTELCSGPNDNVIRVLDSAHVSGQNLHVVIAGTIHIFPSVMAPIPYGYPVEIVVIRDNGLIELFLDGVSQGTKVDIGGTFEVSKVIGSHGATRGPSSVVAFVEFYDFVTRDYYEFKNKNDTGNRLTNSSTKDVLGEELVRNGDFSDGLTGWTTSAGGWTVMDGRAYLFGNGNPQSISQFLLVTGKTYWIEFDVFGYDGAEIGVQNASGVVGSLSGSSGRVSGYWVADGTMLSIKRKGSVVTGWIDNISVKEVLVKATVPTMPYATWQESEVALTDTAADAARTYLGKATQTTTSDAPGYIYDELKPPFGKLNINLVGKAGRTIDGTVYHVSVKEQGVTDTQVSRGIVAMQNLYEPSGRGNACMSSVMNRGNASGLITRGHAVYKNRDTTEGQAVATFQVVNSENVLGAEGDFVIHDANMVPLYAARGYEIQSKLANLGYNLATMPESLVYVSEDLKGDYSEILVRDFDEVGDMEQHRDLFMMGFLNFYAPREMHKTFCPGVDSIRLEDYVLIMRSFDDVYMVYLVTNSMEHGARYNTYEAEPEHLKITVNATEMYRGGLATDSLAYFSRGTQSASYTDSMTPTPVTFDRNNALGGTIKSEKSFV